MNQGYHNSGGIDEPGQRGVNYAAVLSVFFGFIAFIAMIIAALTNNPLPVMVMLLFGTVSGSLAYRWRRPLAPDEVVGQVKPSKRMLKALLPGEEIIVTVREHPLGMQWWWLTSAAIVTGASMVGFVWGNYVIMVLALLALVFATGIRLVWWDVKRLAVTNYRLLRTVGVFNQSLQEMRINTITDAEKTAPFASVVLNKLGIIRSQYGMIHPETPGQDQSLNYIHSIPGVGVFHKKLGTVLHRTQS